MKDTLRVNNFDIIRLVAAVQVAFLHTMSHLEVELEGSFIISLLEYFPGVPIFFFVSGFLISKSYESNPAITEYAQNRILRIYPALISCTFIAIISVYFTGYLSSVDFSFGEFAAWIFGQISILQFYNPDFMRGFGTGVLNGSLWTITVELQFYLLAPILYWMFGFAKSGINNTKLLLIILFFMPFHIARFHFLPDYGGEVWFKIYSVSFLPWIYMFLTGVLFQRNFEVLHRILSGKVVYLLLVYLVVSFVGLEYFDWRMGNGISPVLYIFLSMLVFSSAYSCSTLSKKILRGNDISYGVYIYHIPVVNLLIYYGYSQSISYVCMALLATTLIAIASWLFIEKTSMKLKKHPLNPLRATET